jgi:hypothetical protein
MKLSPQPGGPFRRQSIGEQYGRQPGDKRGHRQVVGQRPRQFEALPHRGTCSDWVDIGQQPRAASEQQRKDAIIADLPQQRHRFVEPFAQPLPLAWGSH